MASDNDYHWRNLCRDFQVALENDDNYDVIIRSGKGADTEELRAHSFVLRARCPYFKIAFSDNWKEKGTDGKYTLIKDNISPVVFRIILRYLYTGFLDYEQLRTGMDMIMSVLLAADELCLEELIKHLQMFAVDNEKTFLEEPVSTLATIYKIKSFEILKECCIQRLCSHPALLFSSERFLLMEKSFLEMVLERDDLDMKEVDVWDSVLRWHFAKYLKNNGDKNSLSSTDSRNIKESLKYFIPLIRMYDIAKDDFYLKVYPYKNLLGDELLDDLLRWHLIPNAIPKLAFKPPRRSCNSLLVKREVFNLFEKWIHVANAKSNTVKFRLLLRGTRDGFGAERFHNLCDNKGSTLVVTKLTNSKKIVGGYNPLQWSSSNRYLATNKSFIFILDPSNLKSAELGHINSNCNNNAIYDYSGYGPTFGSGHDLISREGTQWISNMNGTYSRIALPNSFEADDYEVFQVQQ